MHCGQTAGPRGDHFKEKQLWGMGLSAQIEISSIVMLTQERVENILKFYNLSLMKHVFWCPSKFTVTIHTVDLITSTTLNYSLRKLHKVQR